MPHDAVTLNPSLRVTLLTSWSRTGLAGSGVVTSVTSVRDGLASAGVMADVISFPGQQRRYLPTTLQRIAFNYRLAPGRFHHAGLVFGFDFDGFAVARRLPCPLLQINGGILADILRFEHGLPRRLLHWQSRLEGRAARAATAVITPSRYAASVIQAAYAVPARKIHVLPFGIDLAQWTPPAAARPLGGRDPVILCVAKLYPRKNVPRLLEAFSLVAEALPQARLEIAGDGLQLKELHARVACHPARSHIVLHGAIPHDSLPELFHRARVFCLPSLHETFGFAFLEAMAAGLPVVALSQTAVPEMVLDGRTGLLARTDSAPELAALLIRLLQEPVLAQQLGAGGRQRAAVYSLSRSGRWWREVVEQYHR